MFAMGSPCRLDVIIRAKRDALRHLPQDHAHKVSVGRANMQGDTHRVLVVGIGAHNSVPIPLTKVGLRGQGGERERAQASRTRGEGEAREGGAIRKVYGQDVLW